jgi:hypothetical protein
MSSTEWGSEVFPGVFFSRGTAPSLNPVGDGDATPEVTVQRIHEAIEKCRDTIRRLVSSNTYMVEFLEERGYGREGGAASTAYDLPPISSIAEDDRVVHEAVVENRAIIKEREAELEVLLGLIAGQHCAREAPIVEDTSVAERGSDGSGEGSSEEESSEEEYTGPLEDVSSMGQLLGSACPTRNTFTL